MRVAELGRPNSLLLFLHPASALQRQPGSPLNGLIRDVSLRGALLTRIKLKKAVLPASSFKVRLTFSSAKYKGIGALCRPIRFGRGLDFELAVEFEDFWARTDQKKRE